MICVNSPLSRLTTVHFDLLDGLALLATLFLPLYLRYAALFATMLGTTPLSSGTFIPGVMLPFSASVPCSAGPSPASPGSNRVGSAVFAVRAGEKCSCFPFPRFFGRLSELQVRWGTGVPTIIVVQVLGRLGIRGTSRRSVACFLKLLFH